MQFPVCGRRRCSPTIRDEAGESSRPTNGFLDAIPPSFRTKSIAPEIGRIDIAKTITGGIVDNDTPSQRPFYPAGLCRIKSMKVNAGLLRRAKPLSARASLRGDECERIRESKTSSTPVLAQRWCTERKRERDKYSLSRFVFFRRGLRRKSSTTRSTRRTRARFPRRPLAATREETFPHAKINAPQITPEIAEAAKKRYFLSLRNVASTGLSSASSIVRRATFSGAYLVTRGNLLKLLKNRQRLSRWVLRSRRYEMYREIYVFSSNTPCVLTKRARERERTNIVACCPELCSIRLPNISRNSGNSRGVEG